MNEARSRFSITSDFPLINSRGLASSVKGWRLKMRVSWQRLFWPSRTPDLPFRLLCCRTLARSPSSRCSDSPPVLTAAGTCTEVDGDSDSPFQNTRVHSVCLATPESREFLTVVMILPGLERISLLLKHAVAVESDSCCRH